MSEGLRHPHPVASCVLQVWGFYIKTSDALSHAINVPVIINVLIVQVSVFPA